MYEKRERTRKKIVQTKISNWLKKQTKQYNNLSNGTAITLCGSDVNNAIKSLNGISPNYIRLYDLDSSCLLNAQEDLRENNYLTNTQLPFLGYSNDNKNVSLVHKDIYSFIHSYCNCFYYDFCCTYKNVNFNHIREEFNKQIELNNSFSVVFILNVRRAGTKETHKVINEFFDSFKNNDYIIKTMNKHIVYSGGLISGAPMYTWAAVFVNKKDIMEVKMAKKKKGTGKKCEPTREQKMREMARWLTRNRNREYTNQDIADATGLTLKQVGSMAAWYSGKLAIRRKK